MKLLIFSCLSLSLNYAHAQDTSATTPAPTQAPEAAAPTQPAAPKTVDAAPAAKAPVTPPPPKASEAPPAPKSPEALPSPKTPETAAPAKTANSEERSVTDAKTSLGQITQVYRDKKRAVMSVAKGISLPSSVAITTRTGEACEAHVLDVKKTSANLEFADCPDFTLIKAGSAVHPSPFATEASSAPKDPNEPIRLKNLEPTSEPIASEPAAPTSTPRRMRLTVGIGYSNASEIKFDDATFSTTGNSTATNTFKVEPATQFTLGVIESPENSWGFYAGLTYELRREIKSQKIEMNNTTSNFVFAARPTVQFTVLELNALYRWTFIYIPFGFNLSFADFQAAAGTGVKFDTKAALGAQVGVGAYASENVRFELLYQSLRSSVSYTQPGSSADLDVGVMGGLALRAAYDF